MSWLQDAIAHLEERGKVRYETKDFYGLPYSTMAYSPIEKPSPTRLDTHTLDGLCEACGLVEAYAVVVHGPRSVTALSAPDTLNRRDIVAACKPLHEPSFPFCRQLDIETFVVRMQADFVDSPSRDAVLSLVGNIRDEKIATVEDDGVTQVTTVRKGTTGRRELKEVTNPVELAPYRTFPELAQPISCFVLRLHAVEGGLPNVALYDVADGHWQREAVDGIAVYLKSKLGIPVLL